MSLSHSETFAVLLGSKSPALSIEWEHPFFIVIFSDHDFENEDNDGDGELVCAHCLFETADAQIAQGLDLAKRHARIDYDPDNDEWFVPEVD